MSRDRKDRKPPAGRPRPIDRGADTPDETLFDVGLGGAGGGSGDAPPGFPVEGPPPPRRSSAGTAPKPASGEANPDPGQGGGDGNGDSGDRTGGFPV